MKRFVACGTEDFLNSRFGREMLQHRRMEFVDKKQWRLEVDAQGCERDCYDRLTPTYLCVSDGDGGHLGSARLLPLTGRSMIEEVFPTLLDVTTIEADRSWEITRLVGAPGFGSTVLRQILLAGLEFAERRQIESFYGVTTPAMAKILNRLGWPSDRLRSAISAEGQIISCRWRVSQESTGRLRFLAEADRCRLDQKKRQFAGRLNVSA